MPSDPAGPPDDAGKCEQEARKLADLDSGHSAKGLLVAVAERLARDVDTASEVRARIAAVRELMQVLDALDGATLHPRGVPGAVPDDEVATDPEGGPDDDPFDIGDVPPGVGDPPQG